MDKENSDILFESLLVEIRALRQAVENQTVSDKPMNRIDAAAYLQMHTDTLYKLARANKIAYSRKGEGRRASMVFLKADLDDYISRTRIPNVD